MSECNPNLSVLAAATRKIYDRNAERFDTERPKRLHERPWLDRFRVRLPHRATILDLGCGAGDPIAAWFTRCGFHVTGVDFSSSMLAIARRRFPAGDWRQADMRTLDLPERFDGIIGWNSFFHLVPDEQRVTLPRLATHLEPGGALMLTIGPEAGEVTGQVGGERVYHSSLAPGEYEAILAGLGLRVLQLTKEDPDCDRQTVLLAQRLPA